RALGAVGYGLGASSLQQWRCGRRDAAVRSTRHGRWYCQERARQALRTVLPGRYLHHAAVWRYGTRSGDLETIGRDDGRRDWRDEYTWRGFDILVYRAIRTAIGCAATGYFSIPASRVAGLPCLGRR